VGQGIDALDPATLTDLLHKSSLTAGATVSSVERRQVGTGQVASCWELALRLDGHADPITIVAKVSSDDETSRATAAMLGLYEREVRFYEHLASTVVIRTPQCYASSFDKTTGDFVLLLESMSPVGEADQLAGLPLARAELALRELAGLHGPHWGSPTLKGADVVRDDPAAEGDGAALLIPSLFDAFLERHGAALSDEARGVVEWLKPRLATYFAGRDGPKTLIHGDYRTDNLLFDGRDGEVPLAVVDWQMAAHGSGAHDVAYLLTTSLDPQVRRDHERELLAGYLARLVDLGVADYDAAALHADYAWHAFQGIVMLVCAAVIVERTDRGDDMFLTMIERAATAVEDLDSRRVMEP
jgi:aminoglycoside/choline kinase family phosphotransferase